MRDDWVQRAETALDAQVVDIEPLAGGCIGQVYRLRLSDAQDAVAKVSEAAESRLAIEGAMLSFLKTHSELPVPTVLFSSDNLLLMTFVTGNSRFSGAAQESAAELLAALHTQSADAYGLDFDTLIGGLHQPNPWTRSWIEFFAEHRLRYMAREAHRSSRLSQSLLHRIDSMADTLDTWLEEPLSPSLLHGDVWTTNVLADDNRVTAFLDPAIYFGHPEIELAFTTLFGTFGDPFFERYDSISPIRPGFFEVRKDIYNLYPLLVHVRLFGGSYVSSVERTLRRFGY